MKHFTTLATAAICGLALSTSVCAQDVQVQAGANQVAVNTDGRLNNYNSDGYSRRLNRYRNNYGYNPQYNNSNWYYGNPSGYPYQNYDYYGRNYGRTRDYRNYYRSNPNRGYGYYSRPGFYLGNRRSGVYFGF